ncbi:MAG: cytochrome c biogenesis protein ResB [Chloroflexi bacterium]|nr:cytochrome c biogenesis protein ResB [Chloroflexota bacterium]
MAATHERIASPVPPGEGDGGERSAPALRRRLRPIVTLRLLRSREWALGLLALLMAAVVSGTLVPQRALTPAAEFQAWQAAHPRGAALAEAVGLTHVYQSWWFLALLGLLFLSLLVSTVSQARRTWKLDRVRHRPGRGVPSAVRRAGHHAAVSLDTDREGAIERAAAVLAAAGYHVRRDTSAALFAEKGRYGVWGTVVLHFSMLVVLLGGVASGAGKMAGYFELAEGQVFADRRDAFLQRDEGPLFGGGYQGFQVRLDRLRVAYWENGTIREIASAVTLRSPQGEVRQAAISVDRPLSYQGATLYQAKEHGLAAHLILRDAGGQALGTGYVNFPLPKELTQPASNRFSLPATGWQVEADLYPAPGSGPVPPEAWLQARPERPWLYLFVREEDGALLFQGPLALGETVAVGRYALSFPGVARWAGFPLVRDPGLPVVFAGFALCALGSALIYLWAPKRVWAWVEAPATRTSLLRLGGRAERFPGALEEEVAELAARIGRAV